MSIKLIFCFVEAIHKSLHLRQTKFGIEKDEEHTPECCEQLRFESFDTFCRQNLQPKPEHRLKFLRVGAYGPLSRTVFKGHRP